MYHALIFYDRNSCLEGRRNLHLSAVGELNKRTVALQLNFCGYVGVEPNENLTEAK